MTASAQAKAPLWQQQSKPRMQICSRVALTARVARGPTHVQALVQHLSRDHQRLCLHGRQHRNQPLLQRCPPPQCLHRVASRGKFTTHRASYASLATCVQVLLAVALAGVSGHVKVLDVALRSMEMSRVLHRLMCPQMYRKRQLCPQD